MLYASNEISNYQTSR